MMGHELVWPDVGASGAHRIISAAVTVWAAVMTMKAAVLMAVMLELPMTAYY
jgi:hypothetical protein